MFLRNGLNFPTLLSGAENFNGVVSGFVEITNYNGEVVEVLSPKRSVYSSL